MPDILYIGLFAFLAAVLIKPAFEIAISVRRRRAARKPFPYELLRAREGTIRLDTHGIFVTFDDGDEGCAPVVPRAGRHRGQPFGARLQLRSTNNMRGGIGPRN